MMTIQARILMLRGMRRVEARLKDPLTSAGIESKLNEAYRAEAEVFIGWLKEALDIAAHRRIR